LANIHIVLAKPKSSYSLWAFLILQYGVPDLESLDLFVTMAATEHLFKIKPGAKAC
jgi:hypothetical protein